MIRSRRIPPLLSRVCGDGIHTALLLTSDGELLGSSSTTNSVPFSTFIGEGGQNPKHSTGAAAGATILPGDVNDDGAVDNDNNEHPRPPPPPSSSSLNISDVGALVAEVASDYKSLGQDLALLFPMQAAASAVPPLSTVTSSTTTAMAGTMAAGSLSTASSSSAGGGGGDASIQQQQQQQSRGDMGGGGVGGQAPPLSSLKCLIIELDLGVVGISSVGSDCYVVVIGDAKKIAQQEQLYGMLKARLLALASYVQEALTQLGEHL